MKIAILTARGGSKRIPRKNVRPFCGRPMLAWPLTAARESGCFDHILVSTDDEEIAAIAREWGGEVPFLRPKSLADDFAHAHVAARHALEWAVETWGPVESFCHLYPTAPLLSAETIRQGRAMVENGASNAFAAQRLAFPIYQTLAENARGGVEPLFPKDKFMMRSQDMPTAFVDVGQMYWFNTAYFLEHETAIGPKSRLVEVPHGTALDIDTEDDWVFAEKLAAVLRSWEA